MTRLHYADLARPGIKRRRHGKGFVYFRPDGRRLTNPKELARIKALVIPPAWTSVWISPKATAHIQAIGHDDRDRRQYLYHPQFRAERDAAKYSRLPAFAKILPGLRRQVSADMASKGLTRRKIVATVIHLLDRTMIRIGNKTYAEANGSFGLSTLRSRHAEVAGSTVRFSFKGKGGKEWLVAISDRRVAKVIRACQELPGQPLFQYFDDDGGRRVVSSEDVNDYLREATGKAISAKDFRTWAGTVLCAVALADLPPDIAAAGAKRQVTHAIRLVARKLGNTSAVCRACYVHPAILEAFAEGDLGRHAKALLQEGSGAEDIAPAEAAVLKLLIAKAARRKARRRSARRWETSAPRRVGPSGKRRKRAALDAEPPQPLP